MMAFAVPQAGDRPAFTDVPERHPGPTEIAVRVAAASVNAFDVAVAAGRMNDVMPARYPLVLGRDFAGVVTEAGSDVRRFAPGDRVFGMVARDHLGDGSFAGRLLVDTEVRPHRGVPDMTSVAAVPPGLALTAAGALAGAGAAAVRALNALDPRPGGSLLITGASGGVGAYAIQLAAAAGAQVIATARTGAAETFVRELGAAWVVKDIAETNRPVDAVLHLAGEVLAAAALLRPGGRLASPVAGAAAAVTRSDVTAVPVTGVPGAALLDRLAVAAADRSLTVPISVTFPFTELPEAFYAFTAGKLGKVSVVIDQDVS